MLSAEDLMRHHPIRHNVTDLCLMPETVLAKTLHCCPTGGKKNGKKSTEMWQYKITTTERNLSMMAVRI